jgi:hypothetical protein
MKLRVILLPIILLSSIPAHSQQVYIQNECYRNVEQYIPAYQTPDGRYVSGQIKRTREPFPCDGGYGSSYVSQSSTPRCDRNSTIFNGLLGGALGAYMAKPRDRKWAIPLGAAMGISSSRIGCR